MRGKMTLPWLRATMLLAFAAANPLGAFAQTASYSNAPSTMGEIAPVAYADEANEPSPRTMPGDAAPTTDSAPLPLKARDSADRTNGGKHGGGLQSLITVVGGLAIVLGVFFLVVWLMRRASPHAHGALPYEVFETLGRAPLAGQQHVQLLRCGNKLILAAVGPNGTNVLAEINDRTEADRLSELCRQSAPSRPTVSLRQWFQRGEGTHG